MPGEVPFKGGFLQVSDSVYAPAEDSFLLAEAVCAEKRAASAKLALDLGTGSGIQAINLALLGAGKVVAADINGCALRDARANAERFGISRRVSAVHSDMFSSLRGTKFDFIVFNPPYVPSGEPELRDVDGGKRGREALDRFLSRFGKHLNTEGVCYFMQSSLNGTARTEMLLKRNGFGFRIAARKRLFFEELLVYRCVHAH
ncbi:MAG: HemK2/MTQ2 family protein methyltransferase [Candidatus Diapherotrites archaeon]